MKFQPSAIAATNLSKKSGGTVATITNTFRRKSNPRQPRTPKQTAGRARLVSLSTGWGVLTASKQDAWIAAAQNFVFFKNGDAYTLKGNTLYQKLNNNLLRAGQAAITLPPLPVAIPNIIVSFVEIYIFDDLILADGNTEGDDTMEGWTCIGLMTPGMPPGRRNLKNKIFENGPIPYESNAFYNILGGFGVPIGTNNWQEGSLVEMGCYFINNTTGQTTQKSTLQTILYGG